MERKPPLWRRLSATVTGRRPPMVSVIIPAFDAMPYLAELLESLEHQGLSSSEMQLIMIDDGSTDGTAALLDSYGQGRSNVTVLHQQNSGWPGQPRNRGLAVAEGRWVFFADADDYFAPRALVELIDFGERQNAAIVLPRVGRFGTRSAGRPFRETLPAASKKMAFRTFTPHKLVRRSLIDDNAVRFLEGKVRLEDGIFLSRCYLLADKISILADHDYYMLRGRSDGGNISRQRIDPTSYMGSLNKIAQNVYELSRSSKMTTVLIAELLRRKCFRLYVDRFDRFAPAVQQEWLDAHRLFFVAHITPEIRAALATINQERLDLILAGDRQALIDHIRCSRERPSTEDADLPEPFWESAV